MVCLDLSVSSSSWGLERAAVCDCGTPWTFLLPFFLFECFVALKSDKNGKIVYTKIAECNHRFNPQRAYQIYVKKIAFRIKEHTAD